MDIDFSEFEEYVHVNESDLASEWLLQSGRVARIYKVLSDQRIIKEQKKFKYKVACASEAKFARENPQKLGFDNLTAKMISEYLVLSPKVKEAYKEYVQVCSICNRLEGYLVAMVDKRKCLENIPQLIKMGVYSEPKAKRVQ